ncbi:MAG: TonB-dependent receptor [Sphingomonadales bacterium]
MVKMALRRNLLASTIIAGALISVPAFAQTTPAAATSDEASSDTIVVTGSLISNPNLTSSSPVAAVGQEELQLRQTGVAEQVLREIPGVVPGTGQQVNNGQSSAGSTVNLRGLGANRNIVLIDGMRIAPANSTGTVDLNNIPVALLDRLDVLTGGASTTYGADAVSGVVNFITKRDFAGMAFQVGEEITEKGDGNKLRADLTIGANFDDGRGNAVLSIGYQEVDPIYQGDRAVSVFGIGSANGVASGSSFTSSPTTFSFATADLQLNPGATALVPFYNGFNFNPYNIFQTPFRRYNMFAKANYEVSDSVEVYARGMYSKNTTQQIIAASGIFGNDLTTNSANPFLTPAIRAQICTAQGIDPLSATCTANPALPLGAVYRRSVELGPRISTFVTNIFDYMMGAKFTINDHLSFNVRGNYGESENVSTQSGYVSNSRAQQALNATSTTTCLVNTNGCVPLNIFGPSGSITPAMAGFVGGLTSSITDKTSLSQVQGVLQGDLGFSIPWASEAVNFAVGGEYRKYTAERIPDNLAQVPGELGGAGGATLPLKGAYDVYEAFGELIVPIVNDQPFFHELSVEAGGRYSRSAVSAAGNPSNDATTYKVGINWAPVPQLKFRGGYQRAVRAANLFELFAPNSQGLTSLLADPCSGTKPVGNANLTAVCLAQGAPVASIGAIQDPSSSQANATGGGNPNLFPEKADSFNIGAVISGEGFLPGFTATVDYYRILIRDSITSKTSGDAINDCFANITAASATSLACTVIRRNALNGRLSGTSTAANPIPGLFTPLTNAGRLFTDGIDFTVNYKRTFGDIGFTYNLAGNWTNSSTFKSAAASPTRECVGFYSANCSPSNGAIQPEWSWTQRTTFSLDNVDLSLLWRHISAVKYEPGLPALFNGTITGPSPLAGQTVNFNQIPSYDYFDLSTRFAISKELTLTISAFNIFDKAPPVVGAAAGTTGQNSGNTFPSTYDAIGRKFAATVNVRF